MSRNTVMYERDKLEQDIYYLRKVIPKYEKAIGFLMITVLVLLFFGLLYYAVVLLLLVVLAFYITNTMYRKIEELERELLEKDLKGLLI